jgi:hypothetical protein
LGSFERVDGIAFCGENPQIMLYGEEGDDYTAAASYWRSVYSPFGEGQVLLIYLNDKNAENHGHPNYAIYSDNLNLAEYLTLTFNQHFDEYKHLSFGTVKPQPSQFIQDSDSRDFHRIVCQASKHRIELLWEDVRLRQLFIIKDHNNGGLGKMVMNTMMFIPTSSSVPKPASRSITKSFQARFAQSRKAKFSAAAHSWLSRKRG